MNVRAPSRIHITLIDLNASIGRMDGGIGLALEEPFIEVSAKASKKCAVRGKYKGRALEAATRMLKHLSVEGGVEVTVESAYEPHIGLGSGTQVMLSVGKAIVGLYNADVSPRKIAEIMGRGGTSGIGTATFEHGGCILDGGHSTKEKHDFLPSSASKAMPATMLARYEFPDWKIALVIPKGVEIYGKRELDIFQKKCPIQLDEVRRLSHIILMKTLPAVVEKDIVNFGESINEIQRIGFKRIEVELQNQKIKGLLRRCQKNSHGAGLSSFGPTIYAIVEDEEKLLEAVSGEGTVIITKANNTGARWVN